jgi:putative protease
MAGLKDLRKHTALFRNRDMAWDRQLDRPSAERHIDVTLRLDETEAGLLLTISDADGHTAQAEAALALQPARDATRGEQALRDGLGKLGGTDFRATAIDLALSQPWFVPASALNQLRRDAVAALVAERTARRRRLQRAQPVQPPVPYPDDALTYLANVYNHAARDFYARHGVQVIDAAYESRQELGETSLMITKHCVRYSLSLCPKQAKGVTGVQGTIRAEPLVLRHGNDTLTLRFDCKPCEMHVVGSMRKNVLKQLAAEPLTFYRRRPD